MIIVLNFGAGCFANTGKGANIVIRFISWISPVRYATEMTMRRVVKGEPEWFEDATLNYLGYDYGYLTCLVVLVGMTIFFFLFGWMVMLIKLRNV